MIVTVREGNNTPKEVCYITVCDRCNAKFVFTSEDVENHCGVKSVTCPTCSKTIREMDDYSYCGDGCIIHNFKKIPRWRYNRITKKHFSEKEL